MPEPLPEMRTGRTLGRTLYLRTGGGDWKADQCIGIVDTPELAQAIVAAVNAARERGTHLMTEPLVTSEFHLGNLSDKPARDLLRRACREAGHSPVWIRNRAGKILGAIVTEDQARDVAFREMVALGQEIGGG